jgi:hypothetical protein
LTRWAPVRFSRTQFRGFSWFTNIGCSEHRLIGCSFYRWNFLRKSCATCREKCHFTTPHTEKSDKPAQRTLCIIENLTCSSKWLGYRCHHMSSWVQPCWDMIPTFSQRNLESNILPEKLRIALKYLSMSNMYTGYRLVSSYVWVSCITVGLPWALRIILRVLMFDVHCLHVKYGNSLFCMPVKC